jgi:hypothetical protein
MVVPTFGNLLVIMGDSLLNTRLYGGTGEPEDSPNGRREKGRHGRPPPDINQTNFT